MDTPPDRRRLPPSLNQIADLTSVDVAFKLASAFGGTKVIFPRYPERDCVIRRILTLDEARAVCRYYVGCVYIPKLYSESIKTKILNEFGSNREVAIKLGCSTRYVELVRSLARQFGNKKK